MDIDRRTEVRRAFATVIRVELARRGLYGKDLAERTGISTSAVSNYLNSKNDIKLPEFYAIAEALGLDPLTLWDRGMAEVKRVEGHPDQPRS